MLTQEQSCFKCLPHAFLIFHSSYESMLFNLLLLLLMKKLLYPCRNSGSLYSGSLTTLYVYIYVYVYIYI